MIYPISGVRRTLQRLAGLGLLLTLIVGSVMAQGTGQICLSAFEDLNTNQLKDQGEPPITQDILVELANAQGIIVDSLLLNDSPQAGSGVACFQSLEVGQYTITAKSAIYAPTTNTLFLTAVDTSGNVQRFDYGGKLALSAAPASTGGTPVMTPQRQSALIERVLFSSIGALVAIAILGFLGIIIYWTGFRLPPRSQVTPYARSTGQYPAVGYAPPVPGQYTPAPTMRPIDPATGQMQNVAPRPIDIPPATFDDTGPVKAVGTDLSGGALPAQPPIVIDEPPPASDDDTGRYRPKRD